MQLNKYFVKFSRIIVLLVFLFILGAFISRTPGDWVTLKSEDAAKELIVLNKKILNSKTYSFNINYSSFKEYNDVSPYESKNGKVVKDGINLYSQVLGATTIQNKNIRIVIDSAKNFIKITDPLSGPEANFNLSDYIKVLGICKAVKRKQIDKTIAFRFETKSNSGIVAQEIFVDEEFFSKTIIYYSNKHEVRSGNEINSEILRPKLEINISNFKVREKIAKNIFNTDDVLQVSKNEVQLKGKYKAFKYFDGRIKK